MTRNTVDTDTSAETWTPPPVGEVAAKYRGRLAYYYDTGTYGVTDWYADPTDHDPTRTEYRVYYDYRRHRSASRDTVIQTRVVSKENPAGLQTSTYVVKQDSPDKLWVERREPEKEYDCTGYHDALIEEVPLAEAEDLSVTLDTVLHAAEEERWANQAMAAIMRSRRKYNEYSRWRV